MSDLPRLTAEQTAERLGVKLETLYAYVARGLLHRERTAGGSTFDPLDVEAFASARRRRASPTPVRSEGRPLMVIETDFALIDDGELYYRGRPAAELAEEPFEVVARWALTGRWDPSARFAPGPGLAARLGKALAALHDVDRDVVEDAGLPVYEANEYRERRMAELDRAAGTGHVPTVLLTRWEKALEDVGRWRFQSCVTHGDLVAEHVLVDGGDVVGLIDWGEAKVADPADDLAWVAVGADEDALDSVLEAYAVSRAVEPDRSLGDRARLAGELALARWLLHGVQSDDSGIVDDAVEMLRDLADDVGDEAL